MQRASNKIRSRTVAKLRTANIRHRLVLHPTRTLFDRAELIVWNATPEQALFVEQYFANGRMYRIKVSGMGSAQAYVSWANITYKQLPHKQLLLEFGDE